MLLTTFLPRLRLAFVTLTVLMVLGLNHQSVATLRVVPAASTPARTAVAARTSVVKQRVNLEAIPILGTWLAPAATAWLPFPTELPTPRWALSRPAVSAPHLSSVPNFFRARLLRVALSPQAP
ncbi:hypothetical protein [Hymenobacter amundsenii]|uniref:hypothetical protein n=1 Tax=Hymenobacter amundsenii TaxID=2006685 RepID=UPI000F84DFDA|nr:hypothetical protein [Hymenobacter amundsenii]